MGYLKELFSDEYYDTYYMSAIDNLVSHNNFVKNSNLYNIYRNRILVKEANLIKDIINFDDSDDIVTLNNKVFFAFCFLLWNGYLSINKSFQYKDDDNEIDMEHGISIITGAGICRNIVTHYIDLLNIIFPNQVNLVAYTYSGSTPKNNDDKVCNLDHLEVFICNDKGLFLYDPTEFKIRLFSNIGKSNNINPIDLGYNVFRGGFLKDFYKRKEFIDNCKKIDMILSSSDLILLSSDKFNYFNKYITSICNSNIGKINDFYDDINPSYRYVSKSKNNYVRRKDK